MSKQLTLLPMLDGHSTISKDALAEPELLSVHTDIHDTNYQYPSQQLEPCYFDTVKGLAKDTSISRYA